MINELEMSYDTYPLYPIINDEFWKMINELEISLRNFLKFKSDSGIFLVSMGSIICVLDKK